MCVRQSSKGDIEKNICLALNIYYLLGVVCFIHTVSFNPTNDSMRCIVGVSLYSEL